MAKGLELDISYEVRELRQLIERTNVEEPSRADVRALQRELRENPRLWRLAGNAAEYALSKLVSCVSGTRLVSESLMEGVRRKAKELALPEDGSLETLLAEQAALCWLYLHIVHFGAARALAEGSTNVSGWEQRLRGAHHRFTRSLEVLARVRRLARRGPVQVNVAAEGGVFQQVNTAT